MGDAESLKRQQHRYREMCEAPFEEVVIGNNGESKVHRFMLYGVRLAVFRLHGGPSTGEIELVGAAPVTDTVQMTAEEFLQTAVKTWRAIANSAYDTRTVHVLGQSPQSGAWHFYAKADDEGTATDITWVSSPLGGVIPAGSPTPDQSA